MLSPVIDWFVYLKFPDHPLLVQQVDSKFVKFLRTGTKGISRQELQALVRNKKKFTTGIVTDGQIRRLNTKNISLNKLKVKDVMTKNPIMVPRYSMTNI